jgi:hypothetical protein
MAMTKAETDAIHEMPVLRPRYRTFQALVETVEEESDGDYEAQTDRMEKDQEH